MRRTRLAQLGGLRITELACFEDHRSFRAVVTGEPDEAVLLVSLIRSGCMVLRAGGREEFVDPTTGFLLCRGDDAAVAHLARRPDLSTVVQFHQDVHGECPGASGPQVLPVDAGLDLAHRGLVAACRAGADSFEVAERANRLLAGLVGGREPAARPRRAATVAAHRRLVHQACAALIDGPPTAGLEEISRLVGCSPFHLSRVFRAVTGRTLTGYRNQLRVRAVVEELGGARPLRELAAKYGFADQAHLTRVFRRHAGELPKVVRAALRGTTAAPARTEQESSTPRTPPPPK
ncbi:helix-turn-helix transcriptional regulator [Kitasatospora cheerisanensis]|uniref:helix-turn-helix transcriptional regulator n=1 Tax=Kitasatospora cheerisanensis TaxID=81942 RepID=UPI0006904A65|nr:AraC family transcriptional regulator [Kitasatospora cheerisanensis]